jgi:hypothetical protein
MKKAVVILASARQHEEVVTRFWSLVHARSKTVFKDPSYHQYLLAEKLQIQTPSTKVRHHSDVGTSFTDIFVLSFTFRGICEIFEH